jgi:transcriptional regulator GlxA family with amidase domain
MRAQIVLFDGFDELDAIAPFEVLRRAEELGADLHPQLVTLEGTREVSAFYGLRVHAEAALDLDHPPDLLVIPGGGWNAGGSRGVRAEIEHGSLPAAISRLHAGGTVVATVCTGALLAAAAGLTAGRPAITHHAALDDLRATGADVPAVRVRVVDDGDLISAGGVTSGLDLALWLVERFASPALAATVEARLEYERRGTVLRRSS